MPACLPACADFQVLLGQDGADITTDVLAPVFDAHRHALSGACLPACPAAGAAGSGWL
jgi:hypothetical protein